MEQAIEEAFELLKVSTDSLQPDSDTDTEAATTTTTRNNTDIKALSIDITPPEVSSEILVETANLIVPSPTDQDKHMESGMPLTPNVESPKNFGCQDRLSCTCDCNIGSTHDVMQKVMAITGGLGLFAGSIAASVLTVGGFRSYHYLLTLFSCYPSYCGSSYSIRGFTRRSRIFFCHTRKCSSDKRNQD